MEMNEIEIYKKVVKLGESNGVRLTKELSMIDVKVGDVVKVRLTRIEER